MSEAQPYTAADLVGRTLALLRANSQASLGAFLPLTATAVAVDAGWIGHEWETGSNFLLSVGAVVAQYVVIRTDLALLGVPMARRSRFAAFFGLGIVWSLAILAGLVLLVVPGLVLIVRWWIAAPLLISSQIGIIGSLRESWRQTDGRFWPILGAATVIWAPAVAVVAATSLPLDAEMGVVHFAIVNAALYAALIAGWHAAVAAFSFSPVAHDGLADIFA